MRNSRNSFNCPDTTTDFTRIDINNPNTGEGVDNFCGVIHPSNHCSNILAQDHLTSSDFVFQSKKENSLKEKVPKADIDQPNSGSIERGKLSDNFPTNFQSDSLCYNEFLNSNFSQNEVISEKLS